MNMSSDIVYTASVDGATWIKVAGRGTFQNSHQIKKFLLEKIESGCPHIIIDLSECAGMDSTFMGIITGLSIKMHGSGHDPVTLINVTAHNLRLLETLGLDKFMTIKEKIDAGSSLKWEPLPFDASDKFTITKHMVDAHEELLETGGIAKEQFKNVHKLLKEDLERQINKNKPRPFGK